MWTAEEAALFELAGDYIVTSDYKRGLRVAERLLEQVEASKAKAAYVLGCKKAVALRHLGKTSQAKTAFTKALTLADEAGELAIGSYILNDAASMDAPATAIIKIQEAIKLRKKAILSPDQRRILGADIAYFEAHMARMMARRGQVSHATHLITSAKTVIQQFAHHSHPYYKPAYMVVLFWQLEMSTGPKRLQVAAEIATEAAREGRLKVTWQAMLSRRQRAQVLSPEE